MNKFAEEVNKLTEDVKLWGLCPVCRNNSSRNQYQWDFCEKASEIEIDNNSNGICTDCSNFVLRR